MSNASSRSASLVTRAAWALLAVPPLVLALALVSLLSGTGPARDGFWPRGPMTLPEAVALRDAPAVLELLRRGRDPNARAAVRQRIIHEDDMVATAFEAAILAGRGDMLALMLERGAQPSADQVKAMSCLARPDAAPGVVELLRDRLGATPPADCSDAVRR